MSRMKIIVVGGGKVGFAIASETSREGHDVTVIENDPMIVERMSAALDIMIICGNGAALDVQRTARIAECDLLIAATPNDELNMICCILARKQGCPNTIARIRNQEYGEELHMLRRELALSMTINPDAAAAREIFRLLQLPGFSQRDSFAKSRVEIVSLLLKNDNPLCGRKLMDMPRELRQKVLVCAVQRCGEVFIPGGAFQLQEGDEIYVTAPATELARLLENMGMRKKRAKNIMIIGGSRCALTLAEMLLKSGANIKLIEKDYERSRYLSSRLPGAVVLCADGSSQAVLRSENLSQMDAVVTLTDMDEENTVISMYAQSLGVPQAVTKINRTEYNALFQKCGIDCLVSPKDICAQEVVRYVRAMQNTSAESVLALHYLVGGKAEALEFEVPENLPHLGKRLMDISLKPNILLASISRLGKLIFPTGSDHLQKGDTVIVVTAANRVIVELRDIFAD